MEREIKNIIIYGFGRMGITHYAIINQLINNNINVSIIEPNITQRILLRRNFAVKTHKDCKGINKPFDLCLITSPTSAHIHCWEKAVNRGDKSIFVEKPFGGRFNLCISDKAEVSNVHIGYVLRFNPIIQHLKKYIESISINKIDLSYKSNTIKKTPKGWRGSKFSGVTQEMGCHMIDLAGFLLDEFDFELINSNHKSIVSNLDDEVVAQFKCRNIVVDINVNWCCKEIRKPTFGIKIHCGNGEVLLVDSQQISIRKDNIEVNNISITDLAPSCPFYLRGVDYTNQMLSLLSNKRDLATPQEAIKVNNIMDQILNK